MAIYCDHTDSYLPHLEPHGWWRVDPDRPKRCDVCGEPATEVVPDGTKSGLPMCADCAERETKSEEENNGL